MNCQEYRDMIEDALDISLHGELETRVRRHLEHCEGCRAYFVRRRSEHVLLFTSVNAAYSHLRPPPDGFADRIVREVEARRNARRSWRRLALPRWALIAASLALMAGFVFAATIVVDAVTAKDGNIEGIEEMQEKEGTEGSGALAASADVPYVSDVASVFSTDNQQSTTDNQQSTLKGGETMNKRKTATVALSAALAAAPLTAAVADGGGYTSASYVQDGLIAQWDGIDNAGTGTHNPISAVWKDLKGSCDMTLTANGQWANGNALSVANAGAVGTNAAPAYTTIEIVYKMTDKNGRILFASGHAAANGKLAQMVCFSVISGDSLAGFFDGTGASSTRYARYNFDATTVCSMSAVHEDGVVSTVYLNGVIDMYQKLDTNWGLGDGKIMVGDRAASGSGYGWTGEVYSIRLYSTVLTKEQVAANLAVDAARFGVYEYKYVSSGDPIAAATANSCAAAEVTPVTAIEARGLTREWSDGIALDATELHLGMMIRIQ